MLGNAEPLSVLEKLLENITMYGRHLMADERKNMTDFKAEFAASAYKCPTDTKGVPPRSAKG